jgi:hypothetical protein
MPIYCTIWLFGIVFKVSQVFFFREFVRYLERGEFAWTTGLLLIFGLWSIPILDLVLNNHVFMRNSTAGLIVRQIMMAKVYEKSLKMSMCASEGTTGDILNIMSNDCDRVYEGFTHLLIVPWAI